MISDSLNVATGEVGDTNEEGSICDSHNGSVTDIQAAMDDFGDSFNGLTIDVAASINDALKGSLFITGSDC